MKPRVLMLPKWYPHRYDDQDGDFVARHVAAIAPHAHVAVLFATVARGPLPHWVTCEADLSASLPSLRYYYRARLTGLGILDKVLKVFLYFWCIGQGYRRLVRHWGAPPHLVHVHVLLRTGLFAWWLQVWARIPYVITEHWTLYLPINAHRMGRLRAWLTRRVIAQAAALHTVSDNLRQALADLGVTNARSVVIPNVVDTELFHLPDSSSLAEEQRLPGANMLLHVAAFNERAKNLSGILRTMSRLVAKRPSLTLRIAGYGPQEEEVKQLAAELGLLDRSVFFLGKLPQSAIATEMRRANCFVLFSNYENLPCVLIEAQATGLPAVASHVGGVPELVPADGSRGLLVSPGDEVALQRALEKVLDYPERFKPQQLRRVAVAQFSYAAVGRSFAQLYAVVLHGSLTPVSA
ncbi:glycosyltransferase [Hymenobacter sp. GOD-10R]|uniref:glycosyltransferase n=1 Tax=Hymenobacter sp. GOD-10R TaxID=3093922 RepID=UPI002D785ED5|nr:glycosyltransferase [Hymenobacter sp. GOD-10R]WRQ29214.1 glycosyltransferase [Hymenobacter sp. GOD-10R]